MGFCANQQASTLGTAVAKVHKPAPTLAAFALAVVLLAAWATQVHAAEPSSCGKASAADCKIYVEVESVWNEFVKRLSTNQPLEALKLVHSGSVEQFRPSFPPGSNTSDFAKSIIAFDIKESPLIHRGYVDAFLVLKVESGQQMFSITFCLDSDKSWKICSM
jgi:hypothetical protein